MHKPQHLITQCLTNLANSLAGPAARQDCVFGGHADDLPRRIVKRHSGATLKYISIAGALLLILIAFGAPVVATAFHGVVSEWLTAEYGIKAGRLPGLFEIILAGLALLAIMALQPARLFAIVAGKDSYPLLIIKSAIVWPIVATVAWLVAVYFVGGLASLDRSYPITQALCYGLGLFALGAVMHAVVWQRVAMPIMLVGSVLAISSATGALDALPAALSTEGGLAALVGRLTSPPTVNVTSFIIAGALAFLMLPFVHRALRGPKVFTLHLASLVIWVILAHILWMLILFVLGHAALPRWLPIVTAILCGGVIVSAGVSKLLLAGGGLYAQLINRNRIADKGVAAEVVPAAKPVEADRRAWVISYTGVSNEPRVLRQCEALISDGWDVVVCGNDGHSERPENWTFVRLPTTDPFDGQGQLVLALLGKIGRTLVVYGGAELFGWAGRLKHETTPLWLHTKEELLRVVREHPELKADLVICHDYHTSDVGYAVAQAHGAKFSIDVHEYAAGQYFNDPNWVNWQRPVTIATQQHYLPKADVITVVCQGIGELLAEENKLPSVPDHDPQHTVSGGAGVSPGRPAHRGALPRRPVRPQGNTYPDRIDAPLA